MSEELVINESNFNEYFHDVRKNKPQRGQVMARYAACAEFIDGELKRDLVDMLCMHEQPETVVKLMRKIGCATESDAVAVPLAMARDLLAGASPVEVAEKPYRFVCEAFFYTKKEYIPTDDPHWTCVSLHNLDAFLDATDQRIKSRVLADDEKPKDLPTYGHEAGIAAGETSLDDSKAGTGPIIDCE